MPVPPIKALFFDIFGTLVDWHRGVAQEAERVLKPRGINLDWDKFAETWRAGYQAGMEPIRSGQSHFVRLDIIHRRILDGILPDFGLECLDEATRADLNLAWHRLDAWPDVLVALALLRERFLVAAVSNGNISLMVDLDRRNGFIWDAILGAELARDYKPKPQIYLRALEAFGLKPENCMMVATHSWDIEAAAACGLKTAHIARPNEKGSGKGETTPSLAVDVAAADLAALADTLGA